MYVGWSKDLSASCAIIPASYSVKAAWLGLLDRCPLPSVEGLAVLRVARAPTCCGAIVPPLGRDIGASVPVLLPAPGSFGVGTKLLILPNDEWSAQVAHRRNSIVLPVFSS